MKKEELEQQQLFIIDGQLIGCLLYIVSLIVSIIIILDQRKKVVGKKEFLTNEESQILALGNKIFIVLLIIWFLYLNYKSYQLAEETNQDTSALQIQLVASVLSLIVGLMTLYVVATNFQNTNLQTAEIENPFI